MGNIKELIEENGFVIVKIKNIPNGIELNEKNVLNISDKNITIKINGKKESILLKNIVNIEY